MKSSTWRVTEIEKDLGAGMAYGNKTASSIQKQRIQALDPLWRINYADLPHQSGRNGWSSSRPSGLDASMGQPSEELDGSKSDHYGLKRCEP